MSRFFPFLWVIWFWSLAAAPAQAYLDPGSGSLVLQALLVGSAGVLVGLKLLWRRLRSLAGFGRQTGQASSGD